MEIINKKLDEIKIYEKNPRKNDDAVEEVANSIKEFGFKVPIIIDKNNVIVAGHTRYKASKKLGLTEVPCIVANDLTEEQVKAFRLADNKVSEKAIWDYDLLDKELKNINSIEMELFGFENIDIDWADVEDLSEESYEEPQKDMLECPNCHHIDSKNHFRKIRSFDEIEKEKIENYEIKNASLDDIDEIKKIADKYADEIGFVLRPALEENSKNKTLIIAKSKDKILGFCNYHKRGDGVNVIYEICVDYKYRGNGIARALINKIDKPIRLKCPLDNESNNFYVNIGFKLVDVEEGKKRKLNIWEKK